MSEELKPLSELPPDWFITDLYIGDESEEISFCTGCSEDISQKDHFLIPESLAVFIRTHWIGLNKFREAGRREIREQIKQVLDLK